MPTHRQITVEPDENQTASGSKANRAALKALFHAAPQYNDYTAEAVQQLSQAELLDGEVNDMGHTFGTFNKDYSDAPDFADVETGGGGLPASPWVPNPASPTGGVNNPGSIPEAPDGYGQTPADNWGSGIGSQLSPKASSTAISGQVIGDLPPNRSS
tara:strand:- start:2636 stop:3106 length:471 start_codon:yes stop_codon:yes gene_type:complete